MFFGVLKSQETMMVENVCVWFFAVWSGAFWRLKLTLVSLSFLFYR